MFREFPKLTNQLCYAIYNSNRMLNQFYKKKLLAFDLTYTQYIVLLVLWEKDNIKLYELGDTLELSSNTLTPLLKRLEEKGYLRRIQPEKDKRQLVIQLTQAGQALQLEIQSVLNACFSEEIDFSPVVMQQMIADNIRLTQAIKADM